MQTESICCSFLVVKFTVDQIDNNHGDRVRDRDGDGDGKVQTKNGYNNLVTRCCCGWALSGILTATGVGPFMIPG